MNNVRQTAQQQGKTLDAFIEEQGGQQQFGMMMMMQIRELLVQGFALDALFRHDGRCIINGVIQPPQDI